MDPYRSPASDQKHPLFEPERPRLCNELRWLVLGLVLLSIGGPLLMLDVWLDTGVFELPADDDEPGVVVGLVAMAFLLGAAGTGLYGVIASLTHIGERADYRRLRRLAWTGELVHAELPKEDYARVSVALDPSKRFTMQVVVDPNNRSEHHILNARGVAASPRSEIR